MSYEEELQLTAAREDALRQNNYVLANTLKESIDRVRKERIEATFEKLREKAEKGLQEAVNNYNEGEESIENSFREIELAVRERADASFQKAQSTHIMELIEVERIYAADRMRADSRVIREEEILLKRAKVLHNSGDKKGATEAVRQAEEAKEKEMKRRMQEVSRKYQMQRNAAIDRQKNELKILDEKLVNNLQQVMNSKKIQLDVQTNQTRVSIQSLLGKIAEGISLKEFTRKEKAEISKRLNSYAQSYVGDLIDLKFPNNE